MVNINQHLKARKLDWEHEVEEIENWKKFAMFDSFSLVFLSFRTFLWEKWCEVFLYHSKKKKERNQTSGNRILFNSHITSNPKFIFPDLVFQSCFQTSQAWAVLVSMVQLKCDLLDKYNSPFQKPEAAEEHCSTAEDRLCCCQDTSPLQDVQPERKWIVIKKIHPWIQE